MPVRIRGGPNANLRWSLAVSGRGVITGAYEPERFTALAALLRPDDVVWDMGAHYGYATLIAARATEAAGSVVAFEPSSANRWYLARHLRWNGRDDVRILPCAIAEADRTDVFGGSGGSVSFHLGHEGERVQVRSIASLLREEDLPFPSFLKIDIEGAEALALEGARPVLEEARRRGTLPTILVAVHDPELLRACRAELEALGYALVASKWIQRFEAGDGWREDPDLLALPPDRRAEAREVRRLPWFAS